VGVLMILTSLATQAQLATSNLSPYSNADSLVKNVLLGSGVRAFNIEYNTGPGDSAFTDDGIGYFSDVNSTTLGIGLLEGVIMSSGNISDATGPNLTGSKTSTIAGDRSDPDLFLITGTAIRDASVLEFDFVPSSDSVTFRFVFASEEYPEYAGSAFNDPFGFFISGPGISGPFSNGAENIATIPGTSTAITINTLNDAVNSSYYIQNGTGANGIGNAISNPDVQFDAFTVPILATANVIPCDTYHIKLAVADVSDRQYNSAVFLEANSFSSSGIVLGVLNNYFPIYGDTVLFEGCDPNTLTFSRIHSFNTSETLQLGVSGDVSASDLASLPDSITFGVNDTSVSFNVYPFFDNIVDPDELMRITLYSDSNSCLVYDSTVFNFLIKEPDPLSSATSDVQLQCLQPDSTAISVQTLTGQEPYSYQWSNGDTVSSITALSPVNDTTYYVTTYNGCFSDSIVDSVHVFSSDYVSSFSHTIADTFNVFCNAVSLEMTVSMDSNVANYSIKWHESSVVDSTLTLSSPYSNRYFAYTIIESCNGVVSDSLTDSVYVRRNTPTADFSWNNDCVGQNVETFDASSSTFGTAITSWVWDFDNDGVFEQSGQNALHTYQSSGSFPVLLAVQDATGCSDTVSHNVLSYALPQASFAHVNACVLEDVTFTDQSAAINVPGDVSTITNWLWNFGDGSSSSIQNPIHSFDTAGAQQVALIVTTDKGCVDTGFNATPIISFPLPNVSFSHVNACHLEAVLFTDQTSTPTVAGASSSSSSWVWEFGNGDSAFVNNPQHIFPSPGNHSATLTVTTNRGCTSSASNSQQIRSYFLPNPDFSAIKLCEGVPTEFTDLSTSADGIINQWNWKFIGNNGSQLQHPEYTFSTNDTFSVELKTTTDLGCETTILKDVKIYGLPEPYFSYNRICQNETVFINEEANSAVTGQPIVNYYWDLDFDGVTDATGTNASYNFGNAITSHTIELRVEDSFGCTDSVTRPIKVNPNPIVNYSSTNVCLGAPVNFFDLSTIPSGNLVGRNWTFGQGSDSSNLQNPAYLYSSAGAYVASLEVRSDSGCVTSLDQTLNIVVNPLPNVNLTLVNGCLADSLPLLDNSTVAASNLVKWIWYFGDGSHDTIQAPDLTGDTNHLYAAYGFYDVIQTAITDSGCAVQDTQNIQIYEMPLANFNLTKACLNSPSQFFDISTIATDSISEWHWDLGDGNTLNTKNPSYVYATADTFLITFEATSSQGCSDIISRTDTVLPLPISDFGAANVCLDNNLTLVNQSSSINGFGLSAFRWDVQDDDTTDYTSYNASHKYSTHGAKDVELWVEDNYGCQDSSKQEVLIHPEPSAMFDLSNTCQFQEASFVNQSTVAYGNVTQFQYNFGDGQIASGAEDTAHAYSNFGNFSVQLLVTTDSGCVDALSQNILIHEKPVANWSGVNKCLNDSSQFNDVSSIVNGAVASRFWSFGNGQTSASASDQILYADTGTYSVELIVLTDSGCYDTVSKYHVIHDLPLVFPALEPVCPGDLLTLIDTSISQNPFTINQWFWDIQDNGIVDYTGTGNQHGFPFPGTGFYNVELRVEDNYGCTDSLTVTTKVHPHPNAEMATLNACLGKNVAVFDSSVVDTGNIVGWLWDMSTGDTLTQALNLYEYTTTGLKIINLIVTSDDQCRDTVSSTVRVYELPISDFIFRDTCEYERLEVVSTAIEGDTSIVTHEWDFGDLTGQFYGDTQTHLYAGSNYYQVEHAVYDHFGCKSESFKTVELFEQPDIDFSFAEVCDQDSALFLDQTSYNFPGLYSTASWLWSFGDSTNLNTSNNPAHLYSQAGFYDVSLFVTSNKGCVDSIKQQIEIHPRPTADFMWDDTCANKPFAFTDQSTIAWDSLDKWRWNFGNNTRFGPRPINLFDTGGLHNVKLDVWSDFGCLSSITKTVDVMYVPMPTFDVNMTESCTPASFEFTNNTPAIPDNTISYSWRLNQEEISTATNLKRTIFNGGLDILSYQTQLVATSDEGCIGMYALPDTLSVFPFPIARFVATPKRTTTYDALVNFTDSSYGSTDWQWHFDVDSQQGFLENESFDYTQHPGYRNVKLVVKNEYGCADSTNQEIFIEPQPNVYAPNAFTPDGDQINDTWSPKYNDIERVFSFKIYNRWGDLIFDSLGLDAKWDGKEGGIDSPIGNYTYEILYTDLKGLYGSKTGQLLLIL
jgi:gliding motility-associated-like protein